MSKTMQGRLLDKLLKTHYPLTYYLIRQQEFFRVLSTNQSNELFISSESEINLIHKRKASLIASYNLSDTKVPRASKFYNTQNGFNSDQDYYSTHDQSSDNDSEEYDARPMLKSKSKVINGKQNIKRH